MTSEGVETYVILSYSRYKALDQRAKKSEAADAQPEPDIAEPSPTMPEPTPSVVEPAAKDEIGKDVVLKYRTTQMKKLLHHIQEAAGSPEILNLPNLNELIKSALSTSRKKLANEEQFFTFLFDHSLGVYVKNRSKINQYYQTNRPWYQV